MPRFFIGGSNIFGGVAYLNVSDTEHVRALRIRQGECFTVCDGKGTDYTCRLTQMTAEGAEVEVLSQAPSVGEPSVRCTVYSAYSKGDKLETVIQKSVELGAERIILFPSHRCVARPEGAALIKKLNRWQKIAEEAAKQSGRGIIPEVQTVPSFAHAVEAAVQAQLPIFCYEDERKLSLKDALEQRAGCETVSIVTGPEGGFEPSEAAYAVEQGMLSVTMGPRILRCETAPICALSAVMLFTDNL